MRLKRSYVIYTTY